MMKFTDTAETTLLLNGRENWENQLKDLKETFKEFYLISFKIKNEKESYIRYNQFTFTHEVEINCNYNFIDNLKP